MNGYVVRLVDGPAAGWEYHTAITPDPVIRVAPSPSPAHGPWFRLPIDAPPWDHDDERDYRYQRGPVALEPPDGDLVVEYVRDPLDD